MTGAAFYHNYYNYLYTESLPDELRNWVDEQMNCEDILMNYLIINSTRKAPIKITPRKYFKSPSKSISNGKYHMDTRSECISIFQLFFVNIRQPYYTDFRGDPLLFKVKDSNQQNLYSDVGSL